MLLIKVLFIKKTFNVVFKSVKMKNLLCHMNLFLCLSGKGSEKRQQKRGVRKKYQKVEGMVI